MANANATNNALPNHATTLPRAERTMQQQLKADHQPWCGWTNPSSRGKELGDVVWIVG